MATHIDVCLGRRRRLPIAIGDGVVRGNDRVDPFRASREMKAIVHEKYGSPDDLKLREVDKPAVSDDEVLVRVHAASVHPDVWHVVIGRPYVLRLMGAGFSKPKNPIPGTDMAGVVESVGKGVTRFRQGDEAPSRKEAMAVLRELLEAGKITPIVDSTYPLSEAREAVHHMIEGELQGKVIIITAEAV